MHKDRKTNSHNGKVDDGGDRISGDGETDCFN